MEKLPLVGVYRKSPPPESGTKNPFPKGEEPSPLTDRRKTARPHPHSSLCILTLLDSTSSASLLEKWRRDGVRLHRATKTEETHQGGIWVRLLPPQSEIPAKGSSPLPAEDAQAPKEWGLIPCASPVHLQNGISRNAPPHARPCPGGGERVDFPAYVVRLYRDSAESSGSVLSTYI